MSPCRKLPKGDQSWVVMGRTDAEAEIPILWPPDAKSWLIWKDPDAGKDWRWEEKGTTEDAVVGWHHRLNGHEFEQTLGVGDGQGGLVCCSPWGRKESDTTERLNWIDEEFGIIKDTYLLPWAHRKWGNRQLGRSKSQKKALRGPIRNRRGCWANESHTHRHTHTNDHHETAHKGPVEGQDL